MTDEKETELNMLRVVEKAARDFFDGKHASGPPLSHALQALAKFRGGSYIFECKCLQIQSEDWGRHFKGCPLREPNEAPPSLGVSMSVGVTSDGRIRATFEVGDDEHEMVCAEDMSRAIADAVIERQKPA
jgi:hypothetical protein